MSRRAGLPWAPTSLPAMRRQWCHVLEEGVGRLREQGSPLAAQAQEDLAGLAASSLYFVSRDMTDLATSAAESLPEWSPAAALPEPFGLLAWAKPAGVFDWPVPGAERITMPVDAVLWGVKDGAVAVSCAFRTDRIAEKLNPGLARLPLLSHPVGVWDLKQPVAHRVEDGKVAPLAILGSAWLLMGQVRVATTRTIGGSTGGGEPAAAVDDSAVSLIELRRPARDGTADSGGGQRRRSDKRWWVDGHWRQQAWGPKRVLRKPIWISPYIKGDPEGELSERVKVWRR
ncbi:MAG: hypothetical protein U0Q47_12165 [Mycobacterium sp.]